MQTAWPTARQQHQGSIALRPQSKQMQTLRQRVAVEGARSVLARCSAEELRPVAKKTGWLRVVIRSQQRLGQSSGVGSFRSEIGGGVASMEALGLELMPAAGSPSSRRQEDSAASALSPVNQQDRSPRPGTLRTSSNERGSPGRWWTILVPAEIFGSQNGLSSTYPPPRHAQTSGGVDPGVAGWLVLFTDPHAQAASTNAPSASVGGVIPLPFALDGGKVVSLADEVDEGTLAEQFQTSSSAVGSGVIGVQPRIMPGAGAPRVRVSAGPGLELELRWSGQDGQPADVNEWYGVLSELVDDEVTFSPHSGQQHRLQQARSQALMLEQEHQVQNLPLTSGRSMQLTTVPPWSDGAGNTEAGEMKRKMTEHVIEQQQYQLHEHARYREQMDAQQMDLLSQLRQQEMLLSGAKEREVALKRQIERLVVEKEASQRNAEATSLALTEADGTLVEFRELSAMLSLQLDLGLPAQQQANAGHVYALREAVANALAERASQYSRAREQLAATESRVAAQLTRQKVALDTVTKENERLRHEENVAHAEELSATKVEASRDAQALRTQVTDLERQLQATRTVLEQSEIRAEAALVKERHNIEVERQRARDAEDRHATAVMSARSEIAVASEATREQAALERSRAKEMALQMTEAQKAVAEAHKAYQDLQVEFATVRTEADQRIVGLERQLQTVELEKQAEHERAAEAASQSSHHLRELESQLAAERKAVAVAEEEARVITAAKLAAEDEQRRAASEAERLHLELETMRADTQRTLRNHMSMQQQQADAHNLEVAELRLRLKQAEAAEAKSKAEHAVQLTQTEHLEEQLHALAVAREERVSKAIESTASNMEVLNAEVKAASQAISQTIVATSANQMGGMKGHRGHARVLHDFGPAAFAGARGRSAGAGDTETADMMTANGFLPVVAGQLLLIIDDDAPNWTVVRETSPPSQVHDTGEAGTGAGGVPRQGYVPANYIAKIESNPGVAATAKRSTSASAVAAKYRPQDRARGDTGNVPRKRSSRSRSVSPTVRLQHNQERWSQPAAIGKSSSTDRLGESAERHARRDSVSGRGYSADSVRRSLQHRGAVRSSKNPGMNLGNISESKPRKADMLEQAAAAVDPTASTQPQLNSQPQPTGSDAANGTTTMVHLGAGLQLGWRDEGDHHVTPPPVHINTAEAAELLGTETDVEDDVANLLTLTKTDL